MGIATGLIISNVATQNNVEVNEASVVCVSIIANIICDIDVVLKLKSNQSYIKNHRGISHSFLLTIFWIVLISFLGYLSVKQNYFIYLLVAIVGVYSHIFTDLLNGYGVQFLWPIHKKWIALGITYTFDTVLISLHIIAFLLIIYAKTNVLLTFLTIYLFILIYIFISYIYHYQLKKLLIRKYGKYKRLIIQAKSLPFNWKYVYETTDKKFYMGIVRFKTIIQLRYEKRKEILSEALEKEIMKDKNVKTFIAFTPIYNYVIKHYPDHKIDIRFYDLRYLMVRKNTMYYTFNCLIHLENNNVKSSFLGFTINEDNARKKFTKIKEKHH
jgi:inner membrane protein